MRLFAPKILYTSIVLMIYSLTSPSYSENLKICYDQWPPSTIIPDYKNTHHSYVIDMMEEIYKSKGYEIEFITVPYARGLRMIQNGRCDLYAESAYSTDSDKDFFYSTQPTYKYRLGFIVRKDNPWNFKGIESLKNVKVATGIGWDYGIVDSEYQKYLLDPMNKSRVEALTGDEDVVKRILKLILKGRIDTYCDSIYVLEYFANQMGIRDQIRFAGEFSNPLIEKPIFSARLDPEKRKKLIKIWDTERLNYQKSGRDVHIRKQYGL